VILGAKRFTGKQALEAGLVDFAYSYEDGMLSSHKRQQQSQANTEKEENLVLKESIKFASVLAKKKGDRATYAGMKEGMYSDIVARLSEEGTRDNETFRANISRL